MHAITEPALVADLPLDDLLRRVLGRLVATLGADTGAVLLLETDGAAPEPGLRVHATVGLDEAVAAGVRVPLGQGFAGRVAADGPLAVDALDSAEVVNPFFRTKGLRSLAGVPLRASGALIGVVHVGSTRPRHFDREDIRMLHLAGERMALGVERANRRAAEIRTREAVEAASRAKDEFLAMLAHELRNPLAAVQNAIVTAQTDAERRDRALGIARRQSEQLARLVDDLLDVARFTRGRVALRRAPVALAAVVERAVEATRALIDARGHALRVVLPPADLRVDADVARLEQVIANLLTNAAKYTDPGGRLEIVAERRGADAVLRVRDTGLGIAPHVLPRVFDLFAQAERSLDRTQGGLGIGLTIVKQIVEGHGGRVAAHSEGLGKGAEFTVTLPALPAAPAEPAGPPAALPAPAPSTRVVIVEDNGDAAESLALLLDMLGHRVRTFADGPSALAAGRAEPPDVMLVDLGLPGMDGYAVARAVRADPVLRGVRLIALTGYGRDEDRARTRAAGFDHHLVKPVDPTQLVTLVAGPAAAARPTLH